MKQRKVGMIILLLCVALLLCACVTAEENQELKGKTQAIMDAILANDRAAVQNMLSSQVSDAQFDAFYAQAQRFFDGIAEYELKQLGWHKKISNGVTVQQAQYLMTAGEDTYVLQIILSSDMDGIAGFYYDVYTETVTTGTLFTMQGANALQWVFLLIGLAEIGLMIWAVVDCARAKISRKALWIVLILLGSVIGTISAVQGKVSLNFNIGLFLSHTALIRYSTGGFMLRLYLPVGMVAYWSMRRKLLEGAAVVAQQPEENINDQPVLENDPEEEK